MDDPEIKYPKGHFTGKWMGLGIAIFAGLGIPVSIILDNYAFVSLGPALGILFGLAVGASLEKKYEREGRIRPLTPAEKRTRKISVWIGLGLLLMGVAAAMILFRHQTF